MGHRRLPRPAISEAEVRDSPQNGSKIKKQNRKAQARLLRLTPGGRVGRTLAHEPRLGRHLSPADRRETQRIGTGRVCNRRQPRSRMLHVYDIDIPAGAPIADLDGYPEPGATTDGVHVSFWRSGRETTEREYLENHDQCTAQPMGAGHREQGSSRFAYVPRWSRPKNAEVDRCSEEEAVKSTRFRVEIALTDGPGE